MPFAFQFRTQVGVILDDAIMYDSQGTAAIGMGMGVAQRV